MTAPLLHEDQKGRLEPTLGRQALNEEEIALLEKFAKLASGDRNAVMSFADRLWHRANYLKGSTE